MTEVITYPQPHHLGGSFERLLAPTPEPRAPIAFQPARDMSYNPYYNPPTGPPSAPTRQPLDARSSSVSSTSSSISYSGPYNGVPNHHGSISRTLSPASGISDPGTVATVMYHQRSHYPGVAHEHSHASHVQPPPLPSQFLQAQALSPLPVYQPVPNEARFPRPSPYGGYAVGGQVAQQPSPLSYETYQPQYSSFPSMTYHASPPPPPPPQYQASPPVQQSPMMNSVKQQEQNSRFLALLQQLPPEVVSKIHQEIDWIHCWRAALVCKWFRANFHPDKLPLELKVSGVLNLEKYPDYGCLDSEVGKPRKPDSGPPKRFGCFHCFRFKKLDYFEMYRHAGPATKEDSDAEDNRSNSRSPRQIIKPEPSSYTPPPPQPSSITTSRLTPPTTNPHYDPTLTGSSLRSAAAAANNNNRRSHPSNTSTSTSTSTADAGGVLHSELRSRKTAGVRRFCVDCGVAKGYYQPGDLIEVHKPRIARDVLWVCACRVLHHRADITDSECRVCGKHAPFSSRVVVAGER